MQYLSMKIAHTNSVVVDDTDRTFQLCQYLFFVMGWSGTYQHQHQQDTEAQDILIHRHRQLQLLRSWGSLDL